MKSIAALEPLEIGRQDERGRRIAGNTEKEKLLVAFAASGMTQRAFAQREGINYFTFATWLRKKRLAAMAPVTKPAFVEVGLPAPRAPAPSRLEVVLPDGVIIRGSQGAEVAALVRALR
jgi:hypothetical protein